MMEGIKNVGTVLGYISTALALYVMIKTRFLGLLGGYVKKESKSDENDKRHQELSDEIIKLSKSFNEFAEADRAWKEETTQRLKNQNDADMQLLANVVENLYYQKRSVKTLDPIELKRLIRAYHIYHEELEGNSYITALYEEMMDWERVE